MRNAFCRSLVGAADHAELVFLTGDLGFQSLEPLRDALGPRFINAGVAEQNMVSVAAGLARAGLRPWVYSIAPFLYARPYEQIRNDVCLHGLPVVLVGNGGGYGYGVMGATHHALEDYGALLCLHGLRAYIPAFDGDIASLPNLLLSTPHPSYLRLGAAEEPPGVEIPPYAPWRKLQDGTGWLIVVAGPLVGSIWAAVRTLDGPRRPTLWLISELPIGELPQQFRDDVARSGRLLVIEEHVHHGGLAQDLAATLLAAGAAPRSFEARTARGYPSGRYGSQRFHRRECGLDPASILEFLDRERGED
jgi:transketolase